jgi:GNAT superfamily N-acetyltransferase
MLTLRGFLDDDPPLVLRLKEQAGWNQTPADLVRFRTLAPEGSFVAQWDGEPVGCVIAFEFGTVAWIAMMLVDEAFRGRGVGRALMERALEHVDARGIPSVRLDATPMGEPLYEKLGFVRQFEVRRFAGSLTAEAAAAAHEQAQAAAVVLPGLPEHLEGMIDFDCRATNTDRRRLLTALFHEQPDELRVAVHERRVIGYVTSRPGAAARQIGPCMADISAGERLLIDSIARHVGEKLYVDVPADNAPAVHCMERLDLAVHRTLTRMCRGNPVVEDVPRLFASSGPEKG